MSVEYKDYYKTLGVTKKAATEEISKAFKKLARKCHPDLHPNDPKAEGKFKEINEAYEVLRDPEKRKLYDTLGPNWQHGQHFQPPPGYENIRFGFGGPGGQAGFDAGGFSDFFETLFGREAGRGFGGPGPFAGGRGFQQRPRRGQDSEAVYEITLEEAFHGGAKAITLQEQGLGQDGRPGMSSKTLEVKIPAGVKDGQRIRLAGQGHPGDAGGPAGDLFLKIRIHPHHLFKVKDNNVVLDLPLAPWEAALGVTLRVPTLEGAVEMKIPAGMGSGKKLRIRGKGLGSGAARGDQLVRIMIQAPEAQSEDEKKLWSDLAQASRFNPRNF